MSFNCKQRQLCILMIGLMQIVAVYCENGTNRSNLSSLHRIRRQNKNQNNNCNGGFWCKKSGECIDEDSECDGKVDCKDGRDETNACHRYKCPQYLFRCNYGACINPDSVCDGKQDCRDNSDENNCNQQQQTTTGTAQKNCRTNEFECNSGQCIDEDFKCDGIAQCNDNSDEIRRTCSEMKCPGYTYRCDYGACVNGNARCNSLRECHDGSDEAKCQGNGQSTSKPPIITIEPVTHSGDVQPGWCILPQHPENGEWTIWGTTEKIESGSGVSSGTILQTQCHDKYKPIGETLIVCNEGKWSNSLPVCAILCPALTSTNTTTVECTYRGVPTSCNEARSGTIARFTCLPFYEDLQLLRVPQRICQDGSWDLEKPNCVPVCGRKSVNAQTLIVGGSTATKGDYPWQVALYSKQNLICGGSLINQRVIITAAHCVSDLKGNKQPGENYIVSVGKYYRPMEDIRDSDAQFSTVDSIYIPEQFRGENQNFLGDIAVLITTNTFVLSKRVQPICVDWGLNYEQQLTDPTIKGIVTGWGFTLQEGKPAESLKQIEVPYIPYSQCAQQLPVDYENFLTYDKLCSGYVNQSAGVCRGDSGGPLISRNIADGRYYITGIVSISPFSDGSCDIQQYALYTKVSTYIAFIFEKERLFRP